MSGVNITLGLPIIRTSVDHGTAFDIAGKGIANELSLLEAVDYALRLAGDARHRAQGSRQAMIAPLNALGTPIDLIQPPRLIFGRGQPRLRPDVGWLPMASADRWS